MNWLICLTLAILCSQSQTSDLKIYWSGKNIHGQTINVLYGSAVEFRCSDGSVDNLYEVSKAEYDSCEPRKDQVSLLNCTREVKRGRDIYSMLLMKHDIVSVENFKDYESGKKYYFISTAATWGTDTERLNNRVGGNCRDIDMKISFHVVRTISQGPTESSHGDKKINPDPGGADTNNENDNSVDKSDVNQNDNYNTSNTIDTDSNDTSIVQLERTDSGCSHSSLVSSILLLTLCYLLFS